MTVQGSSPPEQGNDAAALASILVDRSPNGVMVTGPDGRIAMVNPALVEMVPLVPDPLGRLPFEAVPLQVLAEALDPAREDELEFPLVSGNRDLLVRVLGLGPAGGRVAILQDVTRLRQADRYRSEFVANVSHELRTPATAIAGYAETLLEDRDSLDPYVVDMVEVIYRNARRLTALFEDLLTLARLDARQGPLPMGSLALGPVLTEAIDKMQVLAAEKQIHFEVFLPSDVRVRGNRDAMGHIMSNLVSNAVKYSFDGGAVTVRAQRRDRWMLVEVIDVGIGIDPVHQERIFERFYRVDRGRSRAAGGTGLGLAIVKKLVDAMGAAIEVRSRPGRGSIFRLLLEIA